MYLMLLWAALAAPTFDRPLPIRARPVLVADDPTKVAEHLQKARSALDAGALEAARLEYVIAVAIERDAGRLPATAATGLAQVLFAMNRLGDAASVLDQLAFDAAQAGKFDVEATALADAVWLHVKSGNANAARVDGNRLLELMRSRRLTPAVQFDLASRYRW